MIVEVVVVAKNNTVTLFPCHHQWYVGRLVQEMGRSKRRQCSGEHKEFSILIKDDHIMLTTVAMFCRKKKSVAAPNGKRLLTILTLPTTMAQLHGGA